MLIKDIHRTPDDPYDCAGGEVCNDEAGTQAPSFSGMPSTTDDIAPRAAQLFCTAVLPKGNEPRLLSALSRQWVGRNGARPHLRAYAGIVCVVGVRPSRGGMLKPCRKLIYGRTGRRPMPIRHYPASGGKQPLPCARPGCLEANAHGPRQGCINRKRHQISANTCFKNNCNMVWRYTPGPRMMPKTSAYLAGTMHTITSVCSPNG